MSGFVLHPAAIADLEEIWDFIAEGSLEAADRVIDQIHEAILSLIPFPEAGHIRADLTGRPLRFHPVRDFLIVYAPGEKPLVVLGVLHGRRNPRVMAAMLRDRE